jgi:hypothetical protein
MHSCLLRPERRQAFARLAVAAVLVAGLAGCATGPASPADKRSPETVPYVGAFTGEYVDGKPLYRFPTIEVVGTRRAAVPGT